MKLFIYTFIIAITLTTSAIAHMYHAPDEDQAGPKCSINESWNGQHIDNIDLSFLEGKPHRILPPNSMMTMDYREDRVNIYTDEAGMILKQTCG